jgi:hypothetical protein
MKWSLDMTMRASGQRSRWIWMLCTLWLIACQQKMAVQPSYKPLQKSEFFPDDRASRPLVEGTVALNGLHEDTQFYEGEVDGKPAETFPFPVTKDVLERGQERFNIFCSPCHDRVGTGQGMIVQRGFRAPPSFHIERLRKTPVGAFFQHITKGVGVMPDYAAQIPPKDRWAIVAYIRALQLSQNANLADLPESERRQIEAKR